MNLTPVVRGGERPNVRNFFWIRWGQEGRWNLEPMPVVHFREPFDAPIDPVENTSHCRRVLPNDSVDLVKADGQELDPKFGV